MDVEGFAAALPVFLDAATRTVERLRQVILDRLDTLDFDQQTEDLIPVDDPGLQPVEVIHSPLATHVRYRIGR